MKKTVFTSFIALLLLVVPAFAQDLPAQTGKADLTASAQNSKDQSAEIKKLKAEPVLTRKQKIEAELRSTINKLELVIDRTQSVIDLLTKNGKDTTLPGASLLDARTALEEATTALDQFSGVVVAPEIKEVSTLSTERSTKVTTSKETQVLKDPLKKTQDALKASKTALIESITLLKEGLLPKDSE